MKTTISVLIVSLLLIISSRLNSKEVASIDQTLKKESLSIQCPPDLYELASNWASEYVRLNPGMEIKVNKTSYNAINQDIDENLSFISNKSQVDINDVKNWKIVVGRNIIVPIMNEGNPFLSEILKRGVSSELFAHAFKTPENQKWGTLLSGEQNTPVHIYIINDESIKAAVAKFLQLNQIPVNGITIGNRDEVVSAIQNDPYAIGFCDVVNVMGPDNQNLVKNVRLLPIDKNGNGKIDYIENIYSDMNLFLRGVWIGKYPKTLSSDIYAVSNEQPTKISELSFLKWILTDGQKFMSVNGYSDLVDSESQSQLDKLTTVALITPPTKEDSQAGLILIIAAMLLITGIIISTGVRHYRNKRSVTALGSGIHKPGFAENSVVVPQGLYFDKTHTWAFMEKDGLVTVGIDDFIPHITGPVTRVEMKKTGEMIKKGDFLFSIIQKGKQLKIYAPVSGIIQKYNEDLLMKSSYINSSPYTDGWVYMIKPENWFKEIQFLDVAEKYKRWIDTEFTRVKDFLAATLKHDSIEYAHIVLQDGGILKDGILSDFGPKIWDDFQTNFLDNYK